MINVGFLGAGDIAEVHAAAVTAVPGARLAVVADVIPERAQNLAGEFGATAVAGLDELLSVPGLDVIYVLTPPAGHAAQIAAIAQAGLPIMCEKPLTLTLAEADQAIHAAQEAGVPLMTGFTHRFNPLSVQAHDLLAGGELGEFVAVWSHRLTHLPVAPDSWLNDLSAGGGLTLQYAIHDLDWECWLAGDPTRVVAQQAHTNPTLAIEDNLWALVQFANGGSGSVGVSWSAPHGWVERGVVGSAGNLRIVNQKQLIGRLSNGRSLDHDLGADYDWFDTFVRESQHVIDCVRGGTPFAITGEDGRQALAVSLAVQQSAKTHQPVNLPFELNSEAKP